MPGRDITRLRNRAARVLFLFTFVTLAGALWVMPAWSQTASLQQDAKPASPPSTNSPSAPPPAASAPEQENQDKDLNDQGVFVIRKDVDEVLLHATVIDDKQHIVTSLDRSAFTVYEDGKPQGIISFHHVDIPVSIGIIIDN